jgi:DNA-binding transcriptional LysR family regulator
MQYRRPLSRSDGGIDVYLSQREGDMEFMQLEMFVAVVEEHSFLLAAERVFRTQPAVSMAIRRLEEEIGAPLLERSCRQSVRLMPRGEMLYDYATRILRLRDEIFSAPSERENVSSGILRGVSRGKSVSIGSFQ